MQPGAQVIGPGDGRVHTMKLEVPLLQLQRELHRIPRGMDRFRQYLRVMLNDDRSDVRLPPLGIMNPMGKEIAH
jgi:hypothetical protein